MTAAARRATGARHWWGAALVVAALVVDLHLATPAMLTGWALLGWAAHTLPRAYPRVTLTHPWQEEARTWQARTWAALPALASIPLVTTVVFALTRDPALVALSAALATPVTAGALALRLADLNHAARRRTWTALRSAVVTHLLAVTKTHGWDQWAHTDRDTRTQAWMGAPGTTAHRALRIAAGMAPADPPGDLTEDDLRAMLSLTGTPPPHRPSRLTGL